MPTVLITGAARGLGLEFARQYAEAGWNVIATARQPSPELEATGARIEMLDASDFDAVAKFGERIDGPLDLLIANAGQMGPPDTDTPSDARAWGDLFTVNTISPVVIVQALLPRLEEVGGKAIAITSKMGSIDDSTTGYIPYRSSKAALNMAWHVLALEHRASGVAMALLHPGWVATDMGGSSAPLQAKDSIAGMRRVIEGLTIEQTGSFLDYEGKPIAW